jgi:hypothetical protein
VKNLIRMALFRLIHIYHAVPLRVYIVYFPLDLHSAAVFDSHMSCRFCAMPRPCRSESDLSRPRHSAAWERQGMCELVSAVRRRHVGDLPAFGFFSLPRGLSRKTRHCWRMAGSRHGMCELMPQGNGMVCVN